MSRRVALVLDLDRAYGRHTDVFTGVMEFAVEVGWDCVIDEFAAHTLSSATAGPRYDGVIARATPRMERTSRRLGIPVVNVWYASRTKRLPTVRPDFDAIGRIAAEHLLDRGFRRCGAIGFPRDPGRDAIVDVFAAVVTEAGAVVERVDVENVTPETFREWNRLAKTLDGWLDDLVPPAGLLVLNATLARIVVQRCHERGLTIPGDVAIVTGHNEESLCAHPAPGLTSIEYGYERVGRRSAELLQAMFDGRPAPEEPVVVPPGALVVRDSTDFHAVSDPLLVEALRFIAANCHRSIDTTSVVTALAVSESTLRRRFRKHLGHGIASEIRRLRLERAKRELVTSDATLRQIARRAGFGDVARLDDTFRRIENCSATEFRRRNRRDV